jgi:hypothetical protein
MMLKTDNDTDAAVAAQKKLTSEVERTGDRLRENANISSKAGRRALESSRSGLGVREHRVARGTMGTRGAEGRNFAGLAAAGSSDTGGFVAAYATVAANIFALTAAFQALQKAAQVDQLRKGLELVGAQAGVSLTFTAKKLEEISGFALTAADSMRATSLAISGGISTKQLEDLTAIARGASIALGRDMSDSMDRLVRGVVKLEPELLDELGIMVRLDDAVAEYAKTHGKLASELTRTERQQAFANAVSEQGLDKYKEIADNIEASPYDKLAASIRNFGTELLRVIATSIGPFIELLSSAPTLALAPLTYILTQAASKVFPTFGGALDKVGKQIDQVNNRVEYFSKLRKEAGKEIKSIKQEAFQSGMTVFSDTKMAAGVSKVLTGDDSVKKAELTSKLEQQKLDIQRQINAEKAKGAAADQALIQALTKKQAALVQILSTEGLITTQKNAQTQAQVAENAAKQTGIILSQQEVVLEGIQAGFNRGIGAGILATFQGVGTAFGQEMDKASGHAHRAGQNMGKAGQAAAKGFFAVGGAVAGVSRGIGLLGTGISMLLGPISSFLIIIQLGVAAWDFFTGAQRKAEQAAKDFTDSLVKQNAEIKKFQETGKGGKAFDALITQSKELQASFEETVEKAKETTLQVTGILSTAKMEVLRMPGFTIANTYTGRENAPPELQRETVTYSNQLEYLGFTLEEVAKAEAILQNTQKIRGDQTVKLILNDMKNLKTKDQIVKKLLEENDKTAQITASYRDLIDATNSVTDSIREFNKVESTPLDKIYTSVQNTSNAFKLFAQNLKNGTVSLETTALTLQQFIKDKPLDKFKEDMNALIKAGADETTIKAAIKNYTELNSVLQKFAFIQQLPPGLKDIAMLAFGPTLTKSIEQMNTALSANAGAMDEARQEYFRLSKDATNASIAVIKADKALKSVQNAQQVADELDKVNQLKLEGVEIDKKLAASIDRDKFFKTFAEEATLLAKRKAEIRDNAAAKIKELSAKKGETEQERLLIDAQIRAEEQKRDAAVDALDAEGRLLGAKAIAHNQIMQYYNSEDYAAKKRIEDQQKMLDLTKELASANDDLRGARLEGRRLTVERQAMKEGRDVTAEEEYKLAVEEHNNKIKFLEDQIENFNSENLLKKELYDMEFKAASLAYQNEIDKATDPAKRAALEADKLASEQRMLALQNKQTEIDNVTLDAIIERLLNLYNFEPIKPEEKRASDILRGEKEQEVNRAMMGAQAFMPSAVREEFERLVNLETGGDGAKILALLQDPTAVTRIQGVAMATETLNSQIETTKEVFNIIEQSITDAFMALVDGTEDGKEAFANMAKAILKQIAQMIVQQMVFNMLSSMGGMFGLPVPAAGGGIIPQTPPVGAAAGGIVPMKAAAGGIIPMAQGGVMDRYKGVEGIVRQPTYLVGEGRYDEAVVPLPNGRAIPVQMHGQSTSQQNNVSVNVNVASNGQATTQTEGPDMNNLGRAIAAAVQKELQAQKRPGGMLNRYGAA